MRGLSQMPAFTDAERPVCRGDCPALALESLSAGAHRLPSATRWAKISTSSTPIGISRLTHNTTIRIVDRLIDRSAAVSRQSFARLNRGEEFATGEQDLYVDLLLFVVFHHHRRALDRLMLGERNATATGQPRAVYRALANEAREFLTIRGQELPAVKDLPHAFACFFQIRRAYKNIFDFIIGVSRPAMRLRATVWESIFTHDMRRYRRGLYREMGDYTTLITGPSGTGKELVCAGRWLVALYPVRSEGGAIHG